VLRTTLVLVGGGLELLGIVLVAAPELFPLAGRAGRSVLRYLVQVTRQLGFRRGPQTVKLTFGASVEMGGRLSLVTTSPDDAPVDQQLAHLRAEAKRSQERLNALEEAVDDQPAKWREDIRELETAVDAKVQAAQDTYLGVRIAGILCLLVGVPIATAANLI
jgi:hypothetical protein